jgi:predicted nucleotidyltransferase
MENVRRKLAHTDIASILFNAYHLRILDLLLLRPARGLHVREIARLTRIPTGSLHRELKLFTNAGLLRRTRVGNQVHYQADSTCSVFEELTAIFRRLAISPAHPSPLGEISRVAEPVVEYAHVSPAQGDTRRSGAPIALRRLDVAPEALAALCRRHHVQKLSFFGSITRDDFRPESDVDVLAEFDHRHSATLTDVVNLGEGLSALFGGRKVDVATRAILNNPYRRDSIQKDLQTAYVARRS